jgi:hypothetical protein
MVTVRQHYSLGKKHFTAGAGVFLKVVKEKNPNTPTENRTLAVPSLRL